MISGRELLQHLSPASAQYEVPTFLEKLARALERYRDVAPALTT
jgi:hypothetical protein